LTHAVLAQSDTTDVDSVKVLDWHIDILDHSFNQGNTNNVYHAIQGHVLGFQVNQKNWVPFNQSKVLKRGLSGTGLTLNEPLVVIDVVPDLSLDLIDPVDVEPKT